MSEQEKQGEREALARWLSGQNWADSWKGAAAFWLTKADALLDAGVLAAQPPRVTPSAEEVRRCVGQPLAERVPDDAMDDDAFDALGDEITSAVLALFAAQPTVQQVREQVAAQIEADMTVRPLAGHDAIRDAARIARGEKGRE